MLSFDIDVIKMFLCWYTREAGRGIEWYASNIFDDEWYVELKQKCFFFFFFFDFFFFFLTCLCKFNTILRKWFGAAETTDEAQVTANGTAGNGSEDESKNEETENNEENDLDNVSE
jgi:hypothetical protein